MHSDEMSIAQVSIHLERKRRRLRELLQERQITSYMLVNVRLSNCFEWTGRLIMAVKKGKNAKESKAEFRGFFNYELKAEEREACREFMHDDAEIALLIEEAVASQYKLTITKDGRSDGYQATMQAHDPKDVNAGLCMSAFAKHWYDALAVLMFKHFKVLHKEWERGDGASEMETFG